MPADGFIRISSPAGDRVIPVQDPALSLAEILAAGGLPLNTRCCLRGLCRGCTIVVAEGTFLEGETQCLVQPGSPREVLACGCRSVADGSLRLSIPPKSLLSHPPVVVSDFRTEIPAGCDPIFSRWKEVPLGVAVDLGTTTVALLLAELGSGRILARASALNAQVRSGDNVLTRIYLCQQDKSRIAGLQREFWNDTFHPLFEEVLKTSGATRDQVAGIVVAGNTTMLHLAAGEDPTPLGTVPFTPLFLNQRVLGLEIAGHEVILLPGISAYVGADIAAGAICCASAYGESPRLLVDAGTNGEILLSGPRGHLACATAAGPAFEGCGLTCGMRAADGVVGRIRLESDPFGVSLEVIGAGEATHGITGSAYIDFLAEGRSAGLLEENGRFSKDFVEAHPGWFSREETGLAFLLRPERPHLRISEVDVALLLQAKSAIAAGVLTLLERQGLRPEEIERVYLAGGFGLHLSVPHAIACGLLPGFRDDQIEAVGNTSLGGAYLAMLDQTLAAEMDALRSGVETVELNLDPGFEDRYLDHLALP